MKYGNINPKGRSGFQRNATTKLRARGQGQNQSHDRGQAGQMHIMEVVTAGLLFLVALNLVANMTVTPAQTPQPLSQAQKLGSDILRILDTTPAETNDHSGFLDEAITTDNITRLRERLDESLPKTISYNLSLVAIDDYFMPSVAEAGVDHGVLVSVDKSMIVLVTQGSTGEQSTTCHRIVHLHAGSVHETGTNEPFKIAEGWYDLSLILWFEPRGD